MISNKLGVNSSELILCFIVDHISTNNGYRNYISLFQMFNLLMYFDFSS